MKKQLRRNSEKKRLEIVDDNVFDMNVSEISASLENLEKPTSEHEANAPLPSKLPFNASKKGRIAGPQLKPKGKTGLAGSKEGDKLWQVELNKEKIVQARDKVGKLIQILDKEGEIIAAAKDGGGIVKGKEEKLRRIQSSDKEKFAQFQASGKAERSGSTGPMLKGRNVAFNKTDAQKGVAGNGSSKPDPLRNPRIIQNYGDVSRGSKKSGAELNELIGNAVLPSGIILNIFLGKDTCLYSYSSSKYLSEYSISSG